MTFLPIQHWQKSIFITWLVLNVAMSVVVFWLLADKLSAVSIVVVLLFITAMGAYGLYKYGAHFIWQNYYLKAELAEKKRLMAGSIESMTEQEFQIIETVFEAWPHPIIIFNKNDEVIFFNRAMQSVSSLPLCRGNNIRQSGFVETDGQWLHCNLGKDWQLDTFSLPKLNMLLVTASNIGKQLHVEKRRSQQNLIRILTHEINNSLTPIASLADSLLCSPEMELTEREYILARIKKRGEGLLGFIQQYAQLTHLPKPAFKTFDFKTMLLDNAAEFDVEVEYVGQKKLIADPTLFEQVVINLIKNAKEATQDKCKVLVEVELLGDQQRLSITDNGLGFSNLDNVLTPLYTTKAGGQGLGLPFCEEVLLSHGGTLALSNSNTGGKVVMTWPLQNTFSETQI